MDQEVKESKNKNKKIIIDIVIIVLIFVGLFVYMLVVDGWDNIVRVVQTVKVEWLIAGLICMIIYWLLEALCLHAITRKIYTKQKFYQSLRVSMIGQLFNNLTPFSSGGQPMQLIAMKSEGKSVSNSATILLIKFIVYQAVLVVYTLFVIIFQYKYFVGLVSNFIHLALIGFFINFVVIVFLIMLGINEKFVFHVIKHIILFLGKIRILRHPDVLIERVEKSVSLFHQQFKMIKQEKWVIARTVIYTIIQLTVFFLVTYMVYRAFGQNGASIIHIVSAQAFLLMIMAFVPIPGAGIAAEGGFLIIFNTFFAPGTINMAILFWRMYTFYLPIIVGTLFMMIHPKNKKLQPQTGILDVVEETGGTKSET